MLNSSNYTLLTYLSDIKTKNVFRKTFGKFLRSYSELLSKFGDIFVQRIFVKRNLSPGLLRWSSLQTKEIKDTPNFISSGSKIVKRLRRRQYDPVIIERTIGLVLGPSTALYEPFLKHCTLTNKAVGDYMTGLVQTSSEATGSWSFSPLIVSPGLLRPSDLSSLSAWRSTAGPIRMSLNIFFYI